MGYFTSYFSKFTLTLGRRQSTINSIMQSQKDIFVHVSNYFPMRYLLLSALSLCLTFLPAMVQGQYYQSLDSAQYHQQKMNGSLNGFNPGVILSNGRQPVAIPQISYDNGSRATGDCGCYIDPDTSWTLAMAPNDDGFTANIPIPFDFCFYGDTITSVFINNNGNVSFGQPFSTFSSTPFPINNFPMVAPFWGDVDTRVPVGATTAGEVWYKITPTALYVNWVEVGYFSMYIDKLNTFSLIMTDGADPVIGNGNNVAFCYKDMEWTTGDASSGVNGFGGVPATVGCNKGDGIDYVQVGRFDGPGTTYDGPFANNDSVSWLDNQSFVFNVCSSTNIPPIVAGLDLCDTLGICQGDTLVFDISFLSPEVGQTTTATINSNGTPDFSVISNVAGPSAEVTAQLVATGANLGYQTITFTATDNGTPPETITVDVVVFVDSVTLAPFVIGDTSYCAGDSVNLSTGNGPYDTYEWSTGDTTDQVFVTQGAYDVTVTLGLCAKGTATFDVIENPAPTPVIAGGNFWCPGGDSITLDAGPGYDSYLWSTTAITQTINAVPGTYTVTVTEDSCTGVSPPFTIDTLNVPIPIVGDTTICPNDTAILDAGAGFDTYAWSNGDTTQTISVGPGTYVVTVTLDSCSSVSDTFTVNAVNAPPLTITGDSSFCAGGFASFTASPGFQTYQWSSGSSFPNLFVNTPGVYTVTVTSGVCTLIDSIDIVEIPIPTPVITGGMFYCPGGGNVLLSAGSGFDTYLWSNSDTTDTSSVLPGTYTVTVTINGCTGTSAPFTVANITNGFSLMGDSTFCTGDTATVSAGLGFDTYLWNTTDTTESIMVFQGSYVVTVTLDTCVAVSDTFDVTELLFTPVSITGDTTYCAGDSALLDAGAGYDTYQWSNSDTTQTVNVLAGSYSVTVTSLNGCIDSAGPFVVTEFSPITPVITGNTHFCFDDTTTLTITTPYDSVLWSNSMTDTSILAGPGTYTVTVVDSGGCSATSLPVTVTSSSPMDTINGVDTLCPGELLTLSVDSTWAAILWNTGDTTNSIATGGGTITVQFTDNFGCTGTDSVVITPSPAIQAGFSIDPEGIGKDGSLINFFDQSQAFSGIIASYLWGFGDGNSSQLQNPTHTYQDAGIYPVKLVVENTDGCKDSLIIDYTVVDGVNPPNIFTPNGDNINDFFVVENLEFFEGSSLSVFNRWGELIFQSDDYRNNWDGTTYVGRPLNDGVYFYILKVPELGEFTGNVTLMRN